jgi:hypothetical protein
MTQNNFRTCFFCGFSGEKVSGVLDKGILIDVCENLDECNKRMSKNIVEKELAKIKILV